MAPARSDPWVFETGTRVGGTLGFEWERIRVEPKTPDDIVILTETSPDGESWITIVRRTLKRTTGIPDNGVGFGEPAADRPPEAAQFDFLVGAWDMSHDLTMATGQQVQFPARSWATHVLGGGAILEHSQIDVDPSLPDAATSIIRIYNRAERRWESLYTNNRGNGLLHFGGVQEGDRVVLHPFQTSRRASTLSRWVFHDIEDGSYRWTGSSSQDRGATFNDTWLIEANRRSE